MSASRSCHVKHRAAERQDVGNKDDDVKYDLWYSERERSGALFHERDSLSGRQKWADARIIWTIDADTYAEAADNCDLALTWRNRSADESVAIPPCASSIRITLAFYLNAQGKDCHIPVPGWVGRIPALLPGTECIYLGLLDHLMGVYPDDFVKLLGYVYVEQPGSIAFDGPAFVIKGRAREVHTVVDLRSADGKERMWQEFDGLIEGEQEISRMVGLRLGPDMSNWTITTAHFFAPSE